MDDYSKALAEHLASGVTQDDLAARVKCTQPAISRYANGSRFPDAKTAREIDTHTEGKVPYALWERIALTKMGIAA